MKLSRTRILLIAFLLCTIQAWAKESISQPVPIFVLQTPYNEEVLHNKFPVFQWQMAALPEDSAADYILKVVEIFPGQTRSIAIVQNAAIFTQPVSGSLYSYSANNPSLLPGHDYAWQVIAFNDGVPVSVSDVWEFSILIIPSNSPVLTEPQVDTSFIEIARVTSLGPVDARGGIGIRLDHPFTETALTWELHSMSMELVSQSGMTVSHPGPNLFFISMLNSNDLTPGDLYKLSVYDKDGNKYDMSIKYMPW